MPDDEIRRIIQEVFRENPTIIDNLKRGKAAGQGYLVGRTLMRLPSGEVQNPRRVLDLLSDELTRA